MPNALGVIGLLDSIGDVRGLFGHGLIRWGFVVLIIIVVLFLVRKVLKSGGGEKGEGGEFYLDLAELSSHGPPETGPTLEYYNTPVRLTAAILAPAGRVRQLPPENRLNEAYEAVLPGLSAVVDSHSPLVISWPPQLSTKGFANKFFQYCSLPGDGGSGTPWCAVAGIVKFEGQPLMAGLLLRTSAPTSHSAEVFESPEEWLAGLRVMGG